MRIGSTRVIFIGFARLSSLRRMTRSDLAGKMRAAPVLSIAVGTLVGAGFKPALAPSLGAGELSSLERDDFSSNHHPALTFCLSMIFFRKPVATFRDHALAPESKFVRQERPRMPKDGGFKTRPYKDHRRSATSCFDLGHYYGPVSRDSSAGATFGIPAIREAGMSLINSSTVNSPLFSYL